MVKAKIQINKKKTIKITFQLISLYRKRKMMLKLKSIHIFALIFFLNLGTGKYKNTIIAWCILASKFLNSINAIDGQIRKPFKYPEYTEPLQNNLHDMLYLIGAAQAAVSAHTHRRYDLQTQKPMQITCRSKVHHSFPLSILTYSTHQSLSNGAPGLELGTIRSAVGCSPAPYYVMPWRYKVQNDVENPSSKRKRMDNTRRLNDLVLYKINCHIFLRRSYFPTFFIIKKRKG